MLGAINVRRTGSSHLSSCGAFFAPKDLCTLPCHSERSEELLFAVVGNDLWSDGSLRLSGTSGNIRCRLKHSS